MPLISGNSYIKFRVQVQGGLDLSFRLSKQNCAIGKGIKLIKYYSVYITYIVAPTIN